MGQDISTPVTSGGTTTGIPNEANTNAPNAVCASLSVSSKKTNGDTKPKMNVALLHETIGNSSKSSRKHHRVNKEEDVILVKGNGTTTADPTTTTSVNEVETVEYDNRSQKSSTEEEGNVEILFEGESNNELMDQFDTELKFTDASSVAEMTNKSPNMESLLSDESLHTDAAQCSDGEDMKGTSQEQRIDNTMPMSAEQQHSIQKLDLHRNTIHTKYSDPTDCDEAKWTENEPDWSPSASSSVYTINASIDRVRNCGDEKGTENEPDWSPPANSSTSIASVSIDAARNLHDEKGTGNKPDCSSPTRSSISATSALVDKVNAKLEKNADTELDKNVLSRLDGDVHGLLKHKQSTGNTPKNGAINIDEIKDMGFAGDESIPPTKSGENQMERDKIKSPTAKLVSTDKESTPPTHSGEDGTEKDVMKPHVANLIPAQDESAHPINPREDQTEKDKTKSHEAKLESPRDESTPPKNAREMKRDDILKSRTTKSPASFTSWPIGKTKLDTTESSCNENESVRSSKSLNWLGAAKHNFERLSMKKDPCGVSLRSSRDPIGHTASLGDSAEVSKNAFDWNKKKAKKSIAEFYDYSSVSDSTIETRDIHFLEKDESGGVRDSIPEDGNPGTFQGTMSIANHGSAFLPTTNTGVVMEEESSDDGSSSGVEPSSSSDSSDHFSNGGRSALYNHKLFDDGSMSQSHATRTSLKINVEEPSRPHTRPEPISIFQRLDDPNSMSMEEDTDIDVRFVEQYEAFFQEFLHEKPLLLERDAELMGFLKVVKLQKILEASSDVEKTLQHKAEIIEHQKAFMSKAYHSQLMKASQAKAKVELELEMELERAVCARKQMEASLTWKRIVATDARAKHQQRIMADLAGRSADGEELMSFLPKLPETELLNDCIWTPPGEKLPVEVDKTIVEFQLDNSFLQAESLILERHTQDKFENAKKHAWVDSIFMQMKDEHLAKLKEKYASKMDGVVLE